MTDTKVVPSLFDTAPTHPFITEIAETLVLSSALHLIEQRGGSTYLQHWKQGEFHHDHLLRLASDGIPLAGTHVVIATNCNAGIKEVLCFAAWPIRNSLWHARCPESKEFHGRLPDLLAYARTVHWFDPWDLLKPDARSELLPEHRERMPGGGWQAKASACGLPTKPDKT